MNKFISLFHQIPSLIHQADIHLPALALSQRAASLEIKPKISMAALAMRTGVSVEPLKYKPYEMNGSVAVIRVMGVLLHNYNWSGSSATGYSVIQNKLKMAREDADVKGILMIYHTPGGSVAGCADTADLIAKVSKEKPIWSISEDAHLSAGEWLASQATRRMGTQSCNAGSIGVVVPHIDYSDYMKESKINVDFIYSGKHKVEGNPYQKMSKEVRADIQNTVHDIRTEFATAVARGTGMTLDAVLDTEAQVYRANDAIDIGLIDEIASPIYLADEFNEHLASAGKIITLGGKHAMSDPKKEEAKVDNVKIIADAKAAGKAEERERITGILGLPEAQGREKLANTLATNDLITVDAAKGILEAAAIESQLEDNTDEEEPGAQALAAIGAGHGEPLESGEDDKSTVSAKQVKSLAANFRG